VPPMTAIEHLRVRSLIERFLIVSRAIRRCTTRLASNSSLTRADAIVALKEQENERCESHGLIDRLSLDG